MSISFEESLFHSSYLFIYFFVKNLKISVLDEKYFPQTSGNLRENVKQYTIIASNCSINSIQFQVESKVKWLINATFC